MVGGRGRKDKEFSWKLEQLFFSPLSIGYILMVKGRNREKWQPVSSHES